ncbi:hypothetical protein ACQKWADRAFT_318431 [Trichoderma austrokoningii]
MAMQVARSRSQGSGVKPSRVSPSSLHRGQKHLRAAEVSPEHTPDESPSKRRRTSLGLSTAEDTTGQEAAGGDTEDWRYVIDFWRREGHWPKKYFEQDDYARRIFEKEKKPPTSLRRKRSRSSSSTTPSQDTISASSMTPSDQKPREDKSVPYRHSKYILVLKTKGVFMEKSELGVTDASEPLCRNLLDCDQATPSGTLFGDDVFENTCRDLEGRNEAKIIQDISRLLVPSAQAFAACGAKHLKPIIESINEGWNNSIPLVGTRPQPDYSVGFKREAFTDDQLEKLSPFIGDWVSGDLSFFMATYYMYFPFLACEVQCGAAALDIADRQNAHSMALAARAVVELFRLVKRENELHRQILSFSVSHDHRSVRIYGYYPVIDGKNTKYYRHPIHDFSFTALGGKENWATICSAIDQLPSDLDFDVEPLPETGLSQELESHHLSQLDTSLASASKQSQSSLADQQVVTPESSLLSPGAAKRPKRKDDDAK